MKKLLFVVFSALLVLLWWTLVSLNLHVETGDENIYLYASSLLLEGFIPSRHYFFAHTIFHQLDFAFLKLIGLKSLFSIRLTLALVAFVFNFLFFVSLKRRFGKWPAFLSIGVFALSTDYLLTVNQVGGLSLSLMALVVALYFLMENQIRWSLVCGFLGMLYTLYFSPFFIVLLVLGYRDKTLKMKDMANFLSLPLIAFALEWLIRGGEYLEQVFLFHLRKPEPPESDTHNLIEFYLANWWLLSLFIVAFVARLLSIGLANTKVSLSEKACYLSLTIACIGLFFANTIHTHYLVSLLPLMVIPIASFFNECFLKSAIKPKQLVPTVTVAGLCLWLFVCLSNSQLDKSGEVKVQFPRLENATGHSWQKAALAPLYNQYRKKNWFYSPIRFYLWNRSQAFSQYKILKFNLEKLCSANCQIYGDASIIGLLAFEIDNAQIWNHFVDTTPVTYATFPEKWVSESEAKPLPDVVVANDQQGLFSMDIPKQWLENRFQRVTHVKDPFRGTYSLWVVKEK